MNDAKELQRILFNILSDVFHENDWKELKYKKILQLINEYMMADYIAIYIHFEKTTYFRLLDTVPNESIYKPEKLVVETKILKSKDFFHTEELPKHVEFVSLELETNETLIIVIGKDHPLSSGKIESLKIEAEKLFTIIHKMRQNSIHNKNNKFLLDVSIKLLKSHDKVIILDGIINALESLYLNNEYYLIVTQEHNASIDLPIKILEYTEESSQQISTQVFMNGELEIERKEDIGKKAIYAPLIGEQSVYGVLEIIFSIDAYISTQELDFIAEFAILAGKAMERTILYENSLEQVTNLTLLNDIIHKLNSSRELSEITELIRDKITSITKASQVGFIYFDEESINAFDVLSGSTVFFNDSIGLEFVQRIKDKLQINHEPLFSGDDAVGSQYGFRSTMVIPMIYAGLSTGFAVILHEKKYYFTFEVFKLMESLIQHSTLAIANTILQGKLQRAVITDFLTQLYSRKYLEDKINEHIVKGTTGVLLLFDIDNFKNVNDQFGHLVGDKILKHVAYIIEKEVENKGIAARWGGEELAVYIPEVSSNEGNEMANNIRETIKKVTNPSITISCGISSWHKGQNDYQEALFLRADQALYKAKMNGKDRVFFL